jgi:zinc protease
MTRNCFFISLIAAGLAFGADEALPKADVILDHFVEVTGGKKAYEKHKNEMETMTMEVVGKGLKGTGTRYADSSGNTLESMTMEGVGKIDSGVYNGIPWETNPIVGPRLRDGAEKADSLRDSRFNSALHWKDMYKSVETTGTAEVNGETCYKVVATPQDGKPETNYFSKKTGLLVKKDKTVISQMGELQVEAFVSGYKEFDGVMVPTSISQKVMGSEVKVIANDVQFNIDIPKDKFEPPADVKKLMAK